MGNRHSGAPVRKPRKNVHWKSAGEPAAPGKPSVALTEPDGSVRLRWTPPAHDGGASLIGYEVECRREGLTAWLKTSPPLVTRPELILSGLEPPHCYLFRVAAVNAVGTSEHSPVSELVSLRAHPSVKRAPTFVQRLHDTTALENDKTEFQVSFDGSPPPVVAWFKDGYEIFSSRRTAITTTDTSSLLVIHETLTSDEGEIRCTITNRLGHALTGAKLTLEAAPKLRYPRQYEDGLLYETNETVYLKTSVVGKPTPAIQWRHDGRPIRTHDRLQITTNAKFSVLKIQNARRSDRGEYQIIATNAIGSDAAAFLLTITAPPEAPARLSVARQLDKSVTLSWEAPADDGGCRVGNYVVEYYRAGWDVWLKATTTRNTTVTLFDLIEGSDYKFRVKAESPYGMSAPSAESTSVRIPGRACDMHYLAVESKIISSALLREDGAPQSPQSDKPEKRRSFQMELCESVNLEPPPPLSLSAPELSGRCVMPFKSLRTCVSSSELLLEHAMARFYAAVAMQQAHQHIPPLNITIDENNKWANSIDTTIDENNKWPTSIDTTIDENNKWPTSIDITFDENNKWPVSIDTTIDETNKWPTSIDTTIDETNKWPTSIDTTIDANNKWPTSIDTTIDETNKWPTSIDTTIDENNKWPTSIDTTIDENNKWATSFDEDYTASTVTTDDSDSVHTQDEPTYNPRGKPLRTTLSDQVKADTIFVPKPILKRRDPEASEPIPQEQPKKQEKSIFKKFTKMPKQKPFSFPKKLNKKEEDKLAEMVSPRPPPVAGCRLPVKEDEGKTVIEYYGNIVKEFGGNKKPQTTLYLKTDELREVAEEQARTAKGTNTTAPKTCDKKCLNTIQRKRTSNKEKRAKKQEATEVLLTTEHATLVIPIDYAQLEQQAAANVRSAFDYALDCSLLLLAFWLFLFEDERLAIPLLALIIYRQVNAAVRRLPRWLAAHTPPALRPAWLT